MFTHQNQLQPNQLVELSSPLSVKYGFEVTIHSYHPYNVDQVLAVAPSRKKPFSIPVSAIKRIISLSLPFEIPNNPIEYEEGQVVELSFAPGLSFEILRLGNESFFYLNQFGLESWAKLHQITRVLSNPLPLEIGDRVIDEDGLMGQIISLDDHCINIDKGFLVTSHNLSNHQPKIKKLPKSKPLRGGKRHGAGRPSTGRKERKTFNLDLDFASKLPDLKMLYDLLQEYRPVAESGTLRSQKLSEFYKKLDSLPYFV